MAFIKGMISDFNSVGIKQHFQDRNTLKTHLILSLHGRFNFSNVHA